ncbi:unnamed protein product [Microthlaspi erraticum]|uniref:Uncharacterized protein n=1 Tax=Microthlaspi erraticum TaxID=1685480 RepID=A0A6D2J2X9_9BRAS|nr:unnamed protein product [Microthlaspi erraticum]
MMNKRSLVPVVRDFPETCGVRVFPDSGDIWKQAKFKRRSIGAHRDFPEFFKFNDESSNHSQTGIQEPEPVLESNEGVKDYQEKEEVVGESEDKLKQSLECSVNSTVEAQGDDVVNTAKRVIVCGLAATSKCPWRQPKKRGGSRKVNDLR